MAIHLQHDWFDKPLLPSQARVNWLPVTRKLLAALQFSHCTVLTVGFHRLGEVDMFAKLNLSTEEIIQVKKAENFCKEVPFPDRAISAVHTHIALKASQHFAGLFAFELHIA